MRFICYRKCASNEAFRQLRTIRRSIALPDTLVEELSTLAPAELRGNWNRLVTIALRQYAARRRALAFESQIVAMAAADPEV